MRDNFDMSDVAGYQHFREPCCFNLFPGEGGSKVPLNFGNPSQHYTASQSRSRNECSRSWKP